MLTPLCMNVFFGIIMKTNTQLLLISFSSRFVHHYYILVMCHIDLIFAGHKKLILINLYKKSQCMINYHQACKKLKI